MSGLFLSLDFKSLFLNNIFIILLFIFTLESLLNKMNSFNKLFMMNIYNSMPLENLYKMKQMLMSIFMFIFLINYFSLFSHFFSLFSLMNFTMIFSFIFWSTMMVLNINYFLNSFLVHLTPSNTPLMLMSFMVIIEMVSQFIRPLTLFIRLGTNLTTGHLILGLISFFSLFSIFIQMIFMLLEMMVAIVQAYVFNLLLLLYFNE